LPFLALLLALCCLAAGCGTQERPSGEAEQQAACGEDARPETVRELLRPAPRGYLVRQLDRSARRRLARLVAPLREQAGDGWRGYEARAVVQRETLTGVVVVVLDQSQQSGSATDYLAGAERGARREGNRVEPVEVAGHDGRLVLFPNGGTTATTLTDRCAAILVFGDEPGPVRRLLRVLRAA
jgi:hypothetical protein